MLQDSTAFFSLSTNRLKDCYHFYKEKLKLEVDLVPDRFIHIHLPGNSLLVIYQKESHQAGTNTALNFQVQNLELVVDELIANGIAFIQYDEPFKTDQKGISWDDNGSHIAWFKDPGGNIIALIEN